MAPTLTILVIEDAEKDPAMVARFFSAWRTFNADADAAVQVIAISQRADSALPALFETEGLDAIFVQADHPRADNGYPIWDICSAARQVWPIVEGEYVTFAHAEFIYGPGRLYRTCKWLETVRPVLAMGNLRRLGVDEPHWKNRLLPARPGMSDVLCRLIDHGQLLTVASLWEAVETSHWAHWRHAPRNDGGLDEDLFFARRDWLETLAVFDQDDRQPYQDVYDLIRTAYELLKGRDLDPPTPRLSRHDCDVYHLDHPRQRQAYALPCYRWFLAHADDWQGTSHGRPDAWEALLSPWATDRQRHQAISDFRHGSDGTVTRWAMRFKHWLDAGGAARVEAYLRRRGAIGSDEERRVAI